MIYKTLLYNENYGKYGKKTKIGNSPKIVHFGKLRPNEWSSRGILYYDLKPFKKGNFWGIVQVSRAKIDDLAAVWILLNIA